MLGNPIKRCLVRLCPSVLILLLLSVWPSVYAIPDDFHAPSYPLIMSSPTFELWAALDATPAMFPITWWGLSRGLVGAIRVDDSSFVWIGDNMTSAQYAHQLHYGLVYPTTTVFDYAAGGVHLQVNWTTPKLPSDWDAMSLPVTYVTMRVYSVDGHKHNVQLYLDVMGDFTVYEPSEKIVWERVDWPDNLMTMRVGTLEQPYFYHKTAGDDVNINWGYMYFSSPVDASVSARIAPATVTRKQFQYYGRLSGHDDVNMPRACNDTPIALAMTWDLGVVGEEPVNRYAMLAYDDVWSVKYFGTYMRPYWRRYGEDASDMLRNASRDYSSYMQRCEEFDADLLGRLEAAVDERYAAMASLSYRQAMRANTLVWHPHEETMWVFNKEISSCGCISTTDVINPMSPVLLLTDPELLMRLLLPLLAYANNETNVHYNLTWAPHHLGLYPVADLKPSKQENMPIEECANFFNMIAATVQRRPDLLTLVYPRYFPIMRQWADYLVDNLPDYKGKQQTTDDFLGPAPHLANLGIKGIIGLHAFSLICNWTQNNELAEHYRSISNKYVTEWMKIADADDHYTFMYFTVQTWSLKYNLFFQYVLDIPVFPESVLMKELNFYMNQVMNVFGVPLDSRSEITRLDWYAWVAAMAPKDMQIKMFSTMYSYLETTPARLPLILVYHTTTANPVFLQGGPEVGGLFGALLLHERNSTLLTH